MLIGINATFYSASDARDACGEILIQDDESIEILDEGNISFIERGNSIGTLIELKSPYFEKRIELRIVESKHNSDTQGYSSYAEFQSFDYADVFTLMEKYQQK